MDWSKIFFPRWKQGPAPVFVWRNSPGVPELWAGIMAAICPLPFPPQLLTSQIKTPEFRGFHICLKSRCTDQMETSLLGCAGQSSECLEELSCQKLSLLIRTFPLWTASMGLWRKTPGQQTLTKFPFMIKLPNWSREASWYKLFGF